VPLYPSELQGRNFLTHYFCKGVLCQSRSKREQEVFSPNKICVDGGHLSSTKIKG